LTRPMIWLAGAATLALLAGGAFAQETQDRAALMAEHRGGTMVLVAQSSEGTLDPHINYTARYWQLYPFLYDGLVAFRQADGPASVELVPDLAEAMPEITNGGKTYTFKLREGIKFSNGKELSTDDVVATFRRIFKILGPTSGTFYNGIVGADACLAEPASCTLEGGVLGDAAARTVTINLVAPDAEFLYKIAVPHAVILPADTPTKDLGNTPAVGTGAYMIESYDPNTGINFVRNPEFEEWSAAAQPDGYPDRIEYRFGVTEEAAVTAVQNGQADWMYDPPPADRLTELGTTYADRVHLEELAAFWYAPMNVNLAPFDDARVRQAVNYAIDRDALVSVFGGPALAAPVCTILPPDFPGHEDRCDYTLDPGEVWSAPDVDKAKALVEESGTKGMKVTVVSDDTVSSRGVGAYLQSVLADLGYDASLQAISSDIQFTYIQNTNNNVQISVSQWYMDYPAASNFLNVLLSCASFHPGSDSSVNIAGFCDEEIDKRMQAAIDLGATDPDAANAEWAKIDQAIMEKAPLAPLFTPKKVNFLSERVGNAQFSKLFHFLIPQAWVQ
jgi:peptide/nickel transport system substrate-binding protein